MKLDRRAKKRFLIRVLYFGLGLCTYCFYYGANIFFGDNQWFG